jgi:hypothetical protein
MERKLAETNIVGQARRLPEKNCPRITRIDANFLKSYLAWASRDSIRMIRGLTIPDSCESDSESPALHVFFLAERAVLISLIHIRAMELLAADPLLPVRIVAAIAFVAMIYAYVYVLRHLRKIEKTIVADNLVPSELGPRNNMVLMVCLIPLIATALLLYLVIKT